MIDFTESFRLSRQSSVVDISDRITLPKPNASDWFYTTSGDMGQVIFDGQQMVVELTVDGNQYALEIGVGSNKKIKFVGWYEGDSKPSTQLRDVVVKRYSKDVDVAQGSIGGELRHPTKIMFLSAIEYNNEYLFIEFLWENGMLNITYSLFTRTNVFYFLTQNGYCTVVIPRGGNGTITSPYGNTYSHQITPNFLTYIVNQYGMFVPGSFYISWSDSNINLLSAGYYSMCDKYVFRFMRREYYIDVIDLTNGTTKRFVSVDWRLNIPIAYDSERDRLITGGLSGITVQSGDDPANKPVYHLSPLLTPKMVKGDVSILNQRWKEVYQLFASGNSPNDLAYVNAMNVANIPRENPIFLPMTFVYDIINKMVGRVLWIPEHSRLIISYTKPDMNHDYIAIELVDGE